MSRRGPAGDAGRLGDEPQGGAEHPAREPAHGGDLRWAAGRYGVAPDGVLDFSASINPHGPPASVRRAMRAALRRVARYPDPEAGPATAALARHLGVAADCVLLTNGGSEALHLSLRHLAPRRVGLFDPCFSGYRQAVRAAGALAVPWSALAWDTGEAGALAARCDVLLVGVPQNPTGFLPPAVAAPAVWDEAFIDFLPDPAAVSRRLAAARGDCVVVGSLTKFFALPGVRLGYVVAAPGAVRRMRALQPEWSVNALAQAAAAAAVEDWAFAAATRRWLPPARRRLEAGLRALGFRTLPSAANFLLAATGATGATGRQWRDALAPGGILIRDAGSLPGLDPWHFRVAVRRPGENRRLLAALAGACPAPPGAAPPGAAP